MNRTSRAKRRRIIAAIVLVVLLAGAGATYFGLSAMRGQRIEQARVDGMALYEQGKLEEAIPKLSQYISHHQDDLEALTAFADARRRVPEDDNSHLAHAMTLYGAVLSLDPNNLEAMKHLLGIYERLGRRLEWMDLADRILEHEPDNYEALRLKAMGYFMQDDLQQALELSDRLIEMRPDDMQWRIFQITLLQRSNEPVDEILQLCERWRQDHDGDGRYEMLMAEILLSVGRRAAAEEMVRQGVERGADERHILQQMVSLLDMINLSEEANQLIADTRDRFPGEQWTFEAAIRRHWQGGNIDAARAELERAEDLLGEFDTNLMRWQTLILVQTGRRDAAREVLDELRARAEAVDEDDRDVILAWAEAISARLEFGERQWREVISAYRTAVGLAPRDAVLHYLIGEAYAQIGEYNMAVTSLARAHQSDPNWVAARVAYAEALLRVGKSERATRLVHDLIQRLDEPGLGLYKLFARSWLASGRPTDRFGLYHAESEQAVGLVDLLEWIVERVPDDPEFQELLVRAALRYDRTAVATATIERLLDDDEANINLLLTLVGISDQAALGYEQALLEHARDIDGLSLRVADATARLLYREGRPQEGLEIIDQALAEQEEPEASELVRQRIRTSYLLMIDHDDKTEAMHRLLDVDDELGSAADYVISQPAVWQDRALVERAIERLEEIAGEDSYRVNLARAEYILHHESDDESRLAEAQVLVNSVLQRAPDSIEARQLMARLYLAGGSPDLANAIDEMKRAVRAHPDEPMLYVRLVRMLQQQGEYADAEEYLDRLARLDVADPNIQRQELELLEAQGDPQRVVDRLSRMPGDAGAAGDSVILITRLHRAGRHQQAIEELEAALANGEPSAGLVRTAMRIYLDLGQPDKAWSVLEKHHDAMEPVDRALTIAAYHQRNHDAAAAREEYRNALELAPNDVRVLTQVAGFFLATGDIERAQELALRGLRQSPNHRGLQQLLVSASFSLGSEARQEALAVLVESVGSEAPIVETVRLFNRVNRRNGELSPTSNDLDDARRLTVRHPQFMPAWRLAIMLHIQAGRRNDAITLATRAVTRLPAHAEPAEIATQLLLESDRLQDAMDMARTWRRRSLDQPLEPDLFIASLALALDRPQRAVDVLQPHARRLIDERDRYGQRPRIWLEALLRTGRIETAMDHFTPLFDERDGYWRQSWLQLAERAPAPHGADALQAVEEVFAVSGEQMLALAASTMRYGRRTDAPDTLQRAIDLAERASEINGELTVQSHLLAAQSRELREEPAEAMAQYREVISMEPDHVVALNNLAVLLMMDEEDCQEAHTLAARAHDEAPDIPEVMDTLAQAESCLGRHDEAERLARMAIDERDGVAEFYITLGAAQVGQEKWDEAAAAIRAIDDVLNDPSALTPYVRQRLRELRASVEQRQAALSGS